MSQDILPWALLLYFWRFSEPKTSFFSCLGFKFVEPYILVQSLQKIQEQGAGGISCLASLPLWLTSQVLKGCKKTLVLIFEILSFVLDAWILGFSLSFLAMCKKAWCKKSWYDWIPSWSFVCFRRGLFEKKSASRQATKWERFTKKGHHGLSLKALHGITKVVLV